MNVFVRVLNGPDAGRTIPLRAGQVAQLGRTEWADFGFPADASLGDVHFELRCGPAGGVVLRNLAAAGTLVDGIETAEASLRPGQKISAGQTTFAILFEPPASANDRTIPAGHAGTATGESRGLLDDESATVESICRLFDVEEAAAPLVGAGLSPGEFVASLIAAGHLRDALRFQSFRLPKRSAVWWAWRCVSAVGESPPPADVAALESAHRWLVEPDDATARGAGDAAESLGYGTASAWVAAAAFWSGDNIAPPVSSAVAPADHLTGTAVSAAVLLGSFDGTPVRTGDRQRSFLAMADKIVRGDDAPPEPA